MSTMKITTKIAVAIIASLTSFCAFAQNQWYITAGYLNSDNKASAAIGGTTLTTNNGGFYVGAGYEAPVNQIDNFYLEGQFLYSYLGDKNGDVTESIHMLNIPFRAKYKVYITDQFGVFGYGGPVASFGLAANDKVGNISYSLYGDDGIINRVDLKLGIGGGIELSHRISFRVGYDWGLFNMSKIGDAKMHINWFHVGVAYNL